MAKAQKQQTQAPAATPPAAPRVEERFFRVTRSCRVPRGASYYTLPEGRVISSVGYDILELIKLGVPLEETNNPNTPLRAQLL